MGKRPTCSAKRRYQWLYLYGFVQPQTGRVEWLLFPTVNTDIFTAALREFARATGCGPSKHIVLVLDQAGWHRAKHLVVPQGLHLVFQPSHTPEVQPAEHLWPLIREALANDWIQSLEHLEQRIIDRVRYLDDHKQLVSTSTRFHWWHLIESPTV